MIPRNTDGEVIESKIDYLETWKGMEECVRQGLTRSIGISNFNSEQIARLLESAEIAPVNNQVRRVKSSLNCFVAFVAFVVGFARVADRKPTD